MAGKQKRIFALDFDFILCRNPDESSFRLLVTRCPRYRWRLRHILVDEYQDTSPAQQQLLQVTLYYSRLCSRMTDTLYDSLRRNEVSMYAYKYRIGMEWWWLK